MVLEIILAIVIIAVILLIFYALVVQPRRRRDRVAKLLSISNGTFDDPAREVLEELNAQRELTPVQHAIRGNIIRYNLLENPREVPRAAPARRQFGRMVQDYERAVRGVGTQFIRGAVHDHTADAENIVRNALTLNDLFGPAVLNPLEDDFDILQMMMIFNGTLMENVPTIQKGVDEARVREATANAPNRAAAVTAALAPAYADDRQNVHDTKVNRDLNEILRKFAAPVNTEAELSSLRRYVALNAGPKRARAEEAIEVMARGGAMSTFGDTEDHILALVWHRCSHPRNAGSESSLRDAVVAALADCFDGEPLRIVCANGRCSRVINSLVVIDYDPSICGAMTFEAYKNLIMQETAEIFDNALKDAANGDDGQRTVAAAYEDPSVEAPAEAEAEFKDSLKTAINNMLETYRAKFNARELEQLRQQCYTYVTI
jgi:hypothetical protein